MRSHYQGISLNGGEVDEIIDVCNRQGNRWIELQKETTFFSKICVKIATDLNKHYQNMLILFKVNNKNTKTTWLDVLLVLLLLTLNQVTIFFQCFCCYLFTCFIEIRKETAKFKWRLNGPYVLLRTWYVHNFLMSYWSTCFILTAQNFCSLF